MMRVDLQVFTHRQLRKGRRLGGPFGYGGIGIAPGPPHHAASDSYCGDLTMASRTLIRRRLRRRIQPTAWHHSAAVDADRTTPAICYDGTPALPAGCGPVVGPNG